MNYREFVSNEMKSRPKDIKPSEYMKTIAQKWREKKGSGLASKIVSSLNPELAAFTKLYDFDCYFEILNRIVKGDYNPLSQMDTQGETDPYKLLDKAVDITSQEAMSCLKLPIYVRPLVAKAVAADLKNKMKMTKWFYDLSKKGRGRSLKNIQIRSF